MLTPEKTATGPGVDGPQADASADRVRAAMDEIESLCGTQARAGAHERLGQLEAALTATLGTTGPDDVSGADASPRVLWALFERLSEAVHAPNLDGVRTAAADLREEFATFDRSHRQAERPYHPDLS